MIYSLNFQRLFHHHVLIVIAVTSFDNYTKYYMTLSQFSCNLLVATMFVYLMSDMISRIRNSIAGFLVRIIIDYMLFGVNYTLYV